MESYTALRNRHQTEVNNFPMGAAFDQRQFDEMMKKFGLKPNETAKVCSLGAGVFIRRSDLDAFKEMMRRQRKELKEALQNEDFAYDSFVTEMFNHECGYTGEFGEAIMALGLSLKDISDSEVLSSAYDKARSYALECA